MNVQYLGRIPFGDAESKQRRLSAPSVLGFESEPTVSVGRRANSTDLLWSAERWSELGFQVHAAERGGQATIHNPGQLICFVSQDIRALGVRGFVCLLKKATENFLLQNGVASYWRDDAPGLYTPAGKIMSLGLRVQNGRTFHGLSINVHNDLAPFQGIQVCGMRAASVDRLPTGKTLENLFTEWVAEYRALLTSNPNSKNLNADFSVRL